MDQQYRFYAFKDAGRFELLYGDAHKAKRYLEAALKLDVSIDTKPEYFELYRYLSTVYQVSGNKEYARMADLSFEKAEKSYGLLTQNIDAVFTHSWMESKRAEMMMGKEAQWLKNKNAITLFWGVLVLAFVVLIIRWLIHSRSKRLESAIES